MNTSFKGGTAPLSRRRETGARAIRPPPGNQKKSSSSVREREGGSFPGIEERPRACTSGEKKGVGDFIGGVGRNGKLEGISNRFERKKKRNGEEGRSVFTT